MLCDKYKNALIDAAMSGAALPSGISEHVDACAQCRETLKSQQALLGAMDGELRSRMNLAVPANFSHRMRAAFEPQPARRRTGYSAVLAFGSLAAVAAVIVAVFFVRDANQSRREKLGITSVQVHQAGSSRNAADREANGAQAPSSERLQSRANASGSVPSPRRLVSDAKNADVLVPAGQEELVVQYMQQLASRSPRITIRADLQSESGMTPVEVVPVEISQLVVRPLPDLSSK